MTSKRKTTFLLWLALLAVGVVGAAVATAADRTDPSFGSGGVAQVPPSAETQGRTVGVTGLALLDGGRLAAAVGGIEGSRYFAVARLGESGALDASFGLGGFTERLQIRRPGFAWEGLRTQAQQLTVEPDGEIVAAGYQVNGSGGTAPLLVRFRADGSRDPSFGRGGVVAPKPGPEVANPLEPFRGGGVLHDVAIQPGGRIVAVGAQNENGGGRPAGMVIAYRPDGSVDRGFGRRGRLVFPARGRDLYTALTSVEVLPNRKVLVAGYFQGRVVLMRLTAAGRIDRGFGGGDGTVLLGGTHFVLCCGPALLAAQPDGRILLGGEGFHTGGATILLARLRPSGKLDRSFGKRGFAWQRVSPRTAGYFVPTDIVLQGRRIVVPGLQIRADNRRREFSVFTVLRYTTGGRLDRSFGDGGAAQLFHEGGSMAGAAVTQGSGRVVVGGGVEGRVDMPPEPALLLTRYR